MAIGKYQEWLEADKLLLLTAWARDGLTDEQIAANIGIARDTLYDWKKNHTLISDALKKGKEVVDIQVENALFKRATGYTFDEVTQELVTVKDKDGSHQEMKVTKIVKKEVQPDTTAQIFWLKNRKPQEWRDRKELEMSGELNNPFKTLKPDELKALIDK